MEVLSGAAPACCLIGGFAVWPTPPCAAGRGSFESLQGCGAPGGPLGGWALPIRARGGGALARERAASRRSPRGCVATCEVAARFGGAGGRRGSAGGAALSSRHKGFGATSQGNGRGALMALAAGRVISQTQPTTRSEAPAREPRGPVTACMQRSLAGCGRPRRPVQSEEFQWARVGVRNEIKGILRARAAPAAARRVAPAAGGARAALPRGSRRPELATREGPPRPARVVEYEWVGAAMRAREGSALAARAEARAARPRRPVRPPAGARRA